MSPKQPNELLSSQKSSDGLQVALHPLPVLEISDHINRAFQRGHKGAIVGALLGQQNGRHITIEYSFTIGTTKENDSLYHMDHESFTARLEQMRVVHKNPPLDLVGWYTLIAKTGPTSDVLPVHTEILERYNDSAVLLGFHLEDFVGPQPPGIPLPVTIYESTYEAEDAGKDAAPGEDAQMRDPEAPPKMALRFRELPFITETGEIEMIVMQFIRENGAQFTLKPAESTKTTSTTAEPSAKGKDKETEATTSQPEVVRDQDENLTKEELEQIAALEAKANATKMMHTRVGLLISYLEHLDPAYLNSDPMSAPPTEPTAGGDYLKPSPQILRQIQALVTNMELVTPAQQEALEKAALQESNDVRAAGLMSDVFTSVNEVREVGKMFAIVEAAKAQNRRQGGGAGGGTGHQPSAAGDLSLS